MHHAPVAGLPEHQAAIWEVVSSTLARPQHSGSLIKNNCGESAVFGLYGNLIFNDTSSVIRTLNQRLCLTLFLLRNQHCGTLKNPHTVREE